MAVYNPIYTHFKSNIDLSLHFSIVFSQKNKAMKLPFFKNFTTVEEALQVRHEVYWQLEKLLMLPIERWESLKVVHDTPEVWRLWLQLGEVRLNLHYILNCDDPFMHFHPWPSIVQCVKGGYLHTTAACNGNPDIILQKANEGKIEEFAEGLTKITTLIVPGSYYIMTDPRQAHSVQVLEGFVANSSIMITGLKYFENASRLLSRKAPVKNPELTIEEKMTVINPIRELFGLGPYKLK